MQLNQIMVNDLNFGHLKQFLLTLCIWGNLTNREDQNEMPHYAAFHQGSTVFVKVKKTFRQNNTIFFFNYNLTLLEMYNVLSQDYCIKPEGRIRLRYWKFIVLHLRFRK